MECPFCKKEIYGLTGLQELQKFQKHLDKCKKNPKRQSVVTPAGDIKPHTPRTDMNEALQIRHDSGQ